MTADARQQRIDRLKAFFREHSPGGCRMLSPGEMCECPLCDVEALVLARGVERTPDLHNAIMNIPCTVPSDADDKSYRIGHREARHAAAELVAARGAVETPAQEPRIDTDRVIAQAIEISKLLADAGIPACPLPEGVRMLIERSARPSPPPAEKG
jgi:hypothetical protein